MAVSLAVKIWPLVISNSIAKVKAVKENKVNPRSHIMLLPPQQKPSRRQHLFLCLNVSLIAISTLNFGLIPLSARAEDENDEGVIGAIKLLFEPNEKTKSGKLLPKAYLKSAKEVVKTLRESLKEDPNDVSKFRRNADSAKDSIREYLSSWRGQQVVIKEESYVELEKAIRSLASFYSKAGPSAPLPEEVKSEILKDLDTAEHFL